MGALMEQKLKADARPGTGKGAARKARAEGRVPGVLYGAGIDTPAALTVDARDLWHVLHTDAGSNVLIDLELDGEKHLALAREIQRDHMRGRLVHVDFMAISKDQTIIVDVPVTIVGESRGVKEGGAVEHHVWDVKVSCKPADVPASIEADVTELMIGDSIRVAELPVPGGVEILTNPEEVVVAVVVPQLLKVEEEVPEGEEGEVAEGEEGAAAEAGAPAEASGTPSEGGEGSE